MRIAVIGAGISGLASAWLLSREHEVILYEADNYLGGHTHTHRVAMHGKEYAVDSGFIVYNTRHYPLLTELFDELAVASQPTTMSFAVRNENSGLEYNAANLNGLFCQRRNLGSLRFLGMIRDLLFRDHLVPLEAIQDEGDGTRRKAGVPRDIGARHGRVLTDRVQHQPFIGLPQSRLLKCSPGRERHARH